ncbi:hypothetical protein HBH98_061470 [Parastagonospora nodorum]|nr:hypothetical protein HBI09_055490 [Parastagonospora nodorum]KAH4188166.1 hypothetical protein HBI95_232430 [Parastagonospora nodorum]KAH4230598.1 hypothetical protein HBI06_087490 [Parastagonospora nodorum]KAH4245618.1 hypothetical protein HBI05_070620 [Parastagonospora nodorum]KAH4268540.1 hypothetical protein HBI03_055530 [Parastagonospora nodorum]
MRSSEPIRPSSRRGASGAWNRLKPVREDVLETYGLPSKGETRLNDFKTQETYLSRIIERYMKLCALNREQLDRLFASVSESKIAENDLSNSFSSLSVSKPITGGLATSKYASRPTTTTTTTTTASNPPPEPHPSIEELATVLQALRKLREAITASNRTDTFARRAYYFNIHVAILCHDWESYVPALHSLLNTLHPRNPLPPHDLRDFVGLMILDQACRQQDYAGARATKLAYRHADRHVEAVVRALVSDDWVGFWRVRRAVDGYQRGVMEWADGRVRVHALKCLGKAYMRADRRFVERCAERGWDDLVVDGVGWELDEAGVVVIRKVKGS